MSWVYNYYWGSTETPEAETESPPTDTPQGAKRAEECEKNASENSDSAQVIDDTEDFVNKPHDEIFDQSMREQQSFALDISVEEESRV